jgi:hypothetical protein
LLTKAVKSKHLPLKEWQSHTVFLKSYMSSINPLTPFCNPTKNQTPPPPHTHTWWGGGSRTSHLNNSLLQFWTHGVSVVHCQTCCRTCSGFCENKYLQVSSCGGS